MAGPVTRFTSVGVTSSPTNNSNGLYAPILTDKQITNIPDSIKKNGGIWYNEDTKNLEAVVNDVVEIVQVGPSGQGDVVGPNVSVTGNIAIFSNTTGKLIGDSGVGIAKVPSPLSFLKFSDSLDAPNITVNEIGNLGHVKFINDVGLIFVDSLMPVEFITNSFGGDTQVCSLFTGGLPSSSTSPSALVELQSDSGALLLSRMTTTERNALSAPSGANGMLLFNTTTKAFDGFDGTNWRALPQLNTNGTLTAADPIVSANLATKNYVDTVIAVPAAAKFIVQVANTSVPNAQVLGALTTGLLKNTITTGVLSIATPGTDYYSLGNPTRILDDTVNFFIGTLAGNLTTSSTSSTGIGINSLTSITSGIDNTSTGNASLRNTTTGAGNSSYGARSLTINIIGNYNSSFGAESLKNNLNDYNCSFGYQSLQSNTNGLNNCSFGYQSLQSNTNGLNNCSFGNKSLLNSTGNNNSAFGHLSLSFNTASNISAFGSGALYSNTTGAGNSAFGSSALTLNITASSNSAFGFQALGSNNASANSAFGYSALLSNLSGANNAAFGVNSLANNTTGSNNTAFGTGAGSTQSIYTNCTFLGASSDVSVNNLTNAIAIGYQSSVSASNCMVLGGSGGNQLSVGIGLTPNAQLQLPTIHANRKIVLYETANNDHQVFGLGTASGIFRYQIDASSSSHVWYTGASSSTSTELMRLTGAGNLGIGASTVNGQLQLGNTVANRKIVLYEAANNDHQYFGFGVNAGALRFQTGSVGDGYIFYAGTSTSTSNELMRLTGGGLLYAKQSNAAYYSTGTAVGTIITTVNVFQKLSLPTGTASFTNFSYSSSRLTYTGLNSINVTITVSIKASYTGGVAGEVSTYAITRPVGSIMASMPSPITSNTEQFATLTAVGTISNGDYFEIWGTHNTGSGTRTVVINNINISISST